MAKKAIHLYIAPQSSEFGSACLAMLADYYGCYTTLPETARLCNVTRDGCTMEQIKQGALAMGFEPKVLRVDIHTLKTRKEPCILLVEGRYAVFESFLGKKVGLCIPDRGHIRMDLKEFEASCGPQAIYLTPPAEGFKCSKRQQGPVRYTFSVLTRANRSYIMRYGLILFLISLLVLAIPFIAGIFTNAIYEGGNSHKILIGEITLNLDVLILILLLIFEIRHVKIFSGLSASISTRCRRDYSWSSLNLPMDFYALRSDGYFMRSTHQAISVGYFLSRQIIDVIIRPVMALICILVIARVSLTSSLVILVSVIILAFFTWMFARYEDNRGSVVFADNSKADGFLLEGLNAIRSIRNSGSEYVFFREYVRMNRNATKSQKPYVMAGGIYEDIPTAVGNLTKIILLLAGLTLMYLGRINYGTLVFVYGVYCVSQDYIRTSMHSGKVLLAIRNQIENLGSIYHEAKKAEKTQAALDQTAKTPPDQPAPIPVEYEKLKGHIELRSVTFGYNRYADPILHDINMEIPAGANIAIVGASGSGKTTLKKLICGRYDPWQGEILYDGTPAYDLPDQVRTGSIASVDQEISLFGDTVMNNIKMWDATQLDADAILAALDAQIHDQIILRDGGYQFVMDDDGNDFSGGERQRIEIARALSTNPTILVMDEATSALDTIVEKKVVEHVKERGITTIVVAHRLSTIKDCDRIYVMDQGRIIASGRHEDLMDSCQLYHSLVTVE